MLKELTSVSCVMIYNGRAGVQPETILQKPICCFSLFFLYGFHFVLICGEMHIIVFFFESWVWNLFLWLCQDAVSFGTCFYLY